MSDGFILPEEAAAEMRTATPDEFRKELEARTAPVVVNVGDLVEAYETEALCTAFHPIVARGLMSAETEPVPVYPTLAMMGEIGELAEKILDEARSEDVMLELGDVLWYVAAAARDLKLGLVRVVGVEAWSDMPYRHPPVDSDGKRIRTEVLVLMLIVAAGKFAEQRIKKPWRDDTAIDRVAASRELRRVVELIDNVGCRYNVTLRQIAQANIDKLVGRRARGTLRGSGDNR